MCILFIAKEQHPDYPVIICANRDEFHHRPSQDMHWWPKHNILAGKDLQAGGTWLGLNTAGDFSALTNFRRPNHVDQNKRSRGELVLNALTSNDFNSPKTLTNISSQYNDFNLVFGTLEDLQAFDSVNKKLKKITTGFHSVSNGALDDIWPKMNLGIKKLSHLIAQPNIDLEALFSVMTNQELASEHNLPNTGISQALESMLSSIFIASADYGTRATAIILKSKTGRIEVHERNYANNGNIKSHNKFHFSPNINPKANSSTGE